MLETLWQELDGDNVGSPKRLASTPKATFGGYTIPTRLRIGWHFGTDRFETKGEFFRVTIDDATYR